MSDKKVYRQQCADTSHPFVRYTTPRSLVVRVPPRKRSKKIPLYGIFPGAVVTKVALSSSENDLLGIVKELIDLQPDAYRSAVKVWVQKERDEGETDFPIYRIGADGKVELKLITPATNGTVYIDHLPVLDLTMPVDIEFNVGDRVRVDLSLDTYTRLVSEYGGWFLDLEKVLGVEGIVTVVHDTSERLVSTRHDSVGITVQAMYMNVLTKICTISAGDTVRIIQDQNKMKELQVGHGGWQQAFVSILGATGHVVRIVDSEDAIVEIAGELFVLNQSCLIFKQHGENVTSRSSDADSRKRSSEVPEAIAEDPYYLNMYRTAIADGKEIDSRIRVSQAGIAEAKDKSIDRRLVSLNASLETDRAEADWFRHFSESVIEYESRKLKRHEEHFNILPYKVCYRCNHETHDLTGSKTITELSELDGEKFVPCPDVLNHDCIPVDDAISQWILDDKSICSPPDGTPLSEKQLGRIAQAVGKNWEFLGYELGISKVEIEHISMDNYTTALRIYRMLVLWTKHNHLATLDHLLRAMQKCNMVTIDWDKIRNMTEGMDMQQPEARSKSRDGTVNIHRDDNKDDTVVEARERPNDDAGDEPHSDRFMCESCEEDKPRYTIKPCGHFLCADCIPWPKQKKKLCAACAHEACEVLEI